MNKATLNINGLIGSDENEKGLELIDVVAAMRKQPSDIDAIELIIGNTPGGFVDVGDDICRYLLSFKKPIISIVKEFCASISTKFFMIGDIRLMYPDAKLMIHNPWIGEVSGNADFLEERAESLRMLEKDFVSLYSMKTGLDKEALSLLMKNEVEISADEAVELGFATGLYKEQSNIAAYYKE